MADEPTLGGPTAPNNLDASLPVGGPVGHIDLSWSDNSDDERCFVVEARLEVSPQVDYEVIAFLPPDTTNYSDGPYSVDDIVTYRIYAASATARSEYSNTDGAGIPHFDPTPSPPPATPTPTPAPPTPTSSQTPPSPSPAPSPTASPTPAQLPKTGGSGGGVAASGDTSLPQPAQRPESAQEGSASATAAGFSLLALAGAFLLIGTMMRRRDDEGREGERSP